MQPRILIADDQQDVLDALRLLLKGHGYSIETVNSPADLLSAVAGREFDILLIDLNYARDTTSGAEGLDLLSAVQARDSLLPVIVMTAWGSVDIAVEAMRRGARDFIQRDSGQGAALAAHQPLGSIMRVRRDAYRASRTLRQQQNQNRANRPPEEPQQIADLPD